MKQDSFCLHPYPNPLPSFEGGGFFYIPMLGILTESPYFCLPNNNLKAINP